MKFSFEYNSNEIYYTIEYNKRNDILIQIENNEIAVIAPLGTSIFAIIKKLKEDAPNIIKILKGNTDQDDNVLKEENSPQSHKAMYLGKSYEIEIIKDEKVIEPIIKLWRGKFIIETNNDDQDTIDNILFNWYVNKANIKIKQKIKQFEHKFKELPKNILMESLENNLFMLRDKDLIIDIMC
ncbi:hypothetical protein AN640_08710, partial [Candidatus Epulonipiscium fishelsonii]